MHEPLGENAGGECESATGAQEQMRAAEDLREIPRRGPSSRRAGLPLMLRERTGENLYLCDDY